MFRSNEVLARLKVQPFVPLRIVTSSGESHEVHHPDLVLVGDRDISIGIANPKNPATYTSIVRIALIHITALQDLPVPTPPSANGNVSPG